MNPSQSNDKAVCPGEVSLMEARDTFMSDWIAAYHKHQPLLAKYRYGIAD
jgi:hypothetical protein